MGSVEYVRRGLITGVLGRILLGGGVLILLFVAYQLWGTGIAESHSQAVLRQRLDAQLHRAEHSTRRTTTTTTTAPSSTTTTATTGDQPTVGAVDRGTQRRQPRRPAAHREDRSQQGHRAGDLRPATCARGRGTTPGRRCPARRATRPSPDTARPTAPRSTTSTSSPVGDPIDDHDRPGHVHL